MHSNKRINLYIDTSTQDLNPTALVKELRNIEKLYSTIGASISNALNPVIDSLNNVTSRIDILTTSIDEATCSLKLLLEQCQIDGEPNGLQIYDSIINTLSLFTSLLGPESVHKILIGLTAGFNGLSTAITTAFGKISSGVVTLGKLLGIGTGGVIALIIAVIAGIAGTIIYWDEISLFFTEKLPSLFADFIKWLGTVTAPIGKALSPIAEEVSKVMQPCWEEITSAWSGLLDFISQVFIEPTEKSFAETKFLIEGINKDLHKTLSTMMFDLGVLVEGSIATLKLAWDSFVTWLNKDILQPMWEDATQSFNDFCEAIGPTFSDAWHAVVEAFSEGGNIYLEFQDGFRETTGRWMNQLVAGINQSISKPFGTLNDIIHKLKNATIFGAQPFSNLQPIPIPQIPYLAKGAVLPANRPFMAIVGDQRHGTNVEAPLATIQEAVAVVMEDQTAAIVAGFNASIGIQRELLSAVLGIRIGDEVIGRAADRYFAKRAAMGGY